MPIRAKAALGVCAYLVACAAIMACFNLGLPAWLELALSLLIAVMAWNRSEVSQPPSKRTQIFP